MTGHSLPGQLALQFSDEHTGHGPDALDALAALETLAQQPRQFTAKAASQSEAFVRSDFSAFLDDFCQQFHVRREGDVLLLDRGVHGDLAFFGVIPVQVNRDLENETCPVFPDAPAEVGEVGVVAWKLPLEMDLAAKGLVVWVLNPRLDDAFIAQVLKLLEDHESNHEPDRLGWPPVLAVETGEFLLESLPGDGCRELEQGVAGSELVDEIRVEEIALVMSGWIGLHHHSRPGDGAPGFLQNHCSFWSRMIH